MILNLNAKKYLLLVRSQVNVKRNATIYESDTSGNREIKLWIRCFISNTSGKILLNGHPERQGRASARAGKGTFRLKNK
jgi:hypothetical protein